MEHVLANTQSLTSSQLKEELTTLKPLLLTLLHEQQPGTVKELAVQIVNRITAQQLISQENRSRTKSFTHFTNKYEETMKRM